VKQLVRARGKGSTKSPISLLLVEGDTDVIFWTRIKAAYLNECRIIIRNLEGNFNINKKVLDKVDGFCETHTDEYVRVYCCLDRESRDGRVPGFVLRIIRRKIQQRNIRSVLSIDAILATQQIESWFFWDIETIYTHLTVPHSRRRTNAYRPPERYTYHDMVKLFRVYNKTYNKGKRCKHFIDQLNLERIIENCRVLREGIELIKRKAQK